MSKIDAKTKLYAFIASPSGHSKSPAMHNCAFEALNINARYLGFEVNKDNLKDVITGFKAMGVCGANVSMPNKQAVIPYLKELTKRARLSRAVNTLILKDGEYYGDITDGVGFKQSCQDKNWDPTNQKVILVGSGGAATAILVQLALDGAKEIKVYNRSRREEFLEVINDVNLETDCKVTFNLLSELDNLKQDMQDAYLFINATGVGMKPYEDMSVIPDISYFNSSLKVADIIYEPKVTKLLYMANEAGCETMNGKLMVIYQGAESFKIWTGQDMPVDLVKKEIGVD